MGPLLPNIKLPDLWGKSLQVPWQLHAQEASAERGSAEWIVKDEMHSPGKHHTYQWDEQSKSLIPLLLTSS